ncbi:DUF4917 family protein [Pedobacter sp. MC2016-14]|uniref:DUF4917 family protein n=1 Tax=Pedobacter sp. MC2016-14 TaxID=2897327 RepID=UPI001E3A73CE|nr:DUF4917 family protein [Pedobacter sp. MC2016-14]MCD0490595.1 DUF4917 family protein [Pedobacter sp. MC2016-14]
MQLNELITYQEVVSSLNKKRKKHLLFGNGFSMAYDSNIFSYNALSKFIDEIGDPVVQKLFESLNTKNFELIMQQLDNFCEIANIFSDDAELVPKIKAVIEKLKNSLIDAVKELHPEHVFKMPIEKVQSCQKFLSEYLSKDGLVFSTNYDLLVYWVLMRTGTENSIDGFGRDLETEIESGVSVPQNELQYSELRWGKHKSSQTINYLHGSLPIFDNGIDIIKVEYDTEHFLLENIKERIKKKEYPIFVTAGNGQEKLTHIMHNKYLSFCYEKLCNIEGSLVTFGFNFGEYDSHIIEAINIAAKSGRRVREKLWSVYIGVYSQEGLDHILKIKSKFKCKIIPYNAKTANTWSQ